ncbi:outer membrane lipid asymmetry maintenance protein MlaD [Citreimonas salinaria]|uniref:Phospholipid/cholesterol/gamma-HCH transport system substrate-binding protein n=1 Tax=Citreimonas salinaria TaxID=321339 RepID=A0A1H3JNJ5_9RHOB|nr:outer membrane lipid asymmetry maintenance protein MlaD [Citreimonas salinaria]SDY41105.1 phospholipid/cholesterol/gamma-HCH transport system substrate-binding protein [Citreimonas salinaria]
MSHSTAEVLVGGCVLAGALGFGLYAMQVTGLSAAPQGYDLHASFRSLEGVSVGTDVRLAGVKVGSVTDIALNPETYRADTTVQIRDDVLIPDDSAILVASEGLLGGNYVELSPGGSPFFYGAGDRITDTQSAVSLISLLMAFVGGSPE